MAKQDDEKKYYVDNARLREVIIEYNRMNIDDNRWLVCFVSPAFGKQVFKAENHRRKVQFCQTVYH